MLSSSYELWRGLRELGFLREDAHPYWWKNSGEFEVVVGAILTQQSRWESVEKSLENLKNQNILSLDGIDEIDSNELAVLIKPSGFYNNKTKVLKRLVKNIKKDFNNFKLFKESVDREWLLAQKGIGKESADSILCYACQREVMVVDSYTNRLVSAFGYEFESYDELQEWMVCGIEENLNCINKAYDGGANGFTIYSRFHGKIVEYIKGKRAKKVLDVDDLRQVLGYFP
jgi:endonuclease-3 related protein